MTTSTLTTPFTRDRVTWMAYFTLAYYSYLQTILGPLMPFLGTELDLSYTLRGMHLSLFALGMVTAGLTADRAAARFGRRIVFWGGGAGMAASAICLTLARVPVLTIASSLGMGLFGSFTLIMIQAILSDRHQGRRAIALTEANVAAAVSATLAPMMVSFNEGAGLGWRTALLIGTSVWLILALTYRTQPLPVSPPPRSTGDHKQALPRIFWLYWLVVLLGVSVEWCMVFWGADFLENSVGFSKVTASGLMTVFFVAMVIGRIGGSRLTRTHSSATLLIYAILTVMIGFPLFWLLDTPALNVMGLFLVGLGVANLFPLTLATATSLAPDQSNRASARVSFGAGIAILAAPQVLGTAADVSGIQGAYAIAAGFIAATFVIAVIARQAARPRRAIIGEHAVK